MATTVENDSTSANKIAAAHGHRSAPSTEGWPFLRRMSIAMRIMVLVVVLVGMTAVLLGALSYGRARHAVEAEAKARLALAGHEIAEHLSIELQTSVADTKSWAHLEVMRALLYHDVDKQVAQFLRQTHQSRPAFRAIACFDNDGRPIATDGETAAISADRPPPASPRFSLVGSDQARPPRLLQLEVAVPNPEEPDSTIGTLVVLLDLQRTLDAVSQLAQGPDGFVSVSLRVRNSGVVLASIGMAEDQVGAATGQAHPPTLESSARVARVADADSPDLEVVVSQRVQTIFAKAIALRTTLLRIGILVVTFSAAIGGVVAWRIGAPIRQLTDAVQEITRMRQIGTPLRIAPRASGEVAVLAASFQAMLDSLVAAQDEAVARSRLVFLGEIAANIAHEVRTPLSVLKTSAQLLARAETSSTDRAKLVDNIAAEVDRLNTVVTNLVDLAHPKPARFGIIHVNPVIERAAAFFRPTTSKSGIEIVTLPLSTDATVYASADQLHQILLNLIQNSIQAMVAPGRIEVRCTREERWVRVDVEDTGAGFSRAALDRAFSPFFTTKPHGTGLGLAISKGIVEEHGGTMNAENRHPNGARVWFHLPIREVAA